MSLSKKLQSVEILKKIKTMSFKEIKELFLEISREWYRDNSEEEQLIDENLTALGIEHDGQTVKAVQEHIAYHYAEKIFPHSTSPEIFAKFIDSNIDCSKAEKQLKEAKAKGGVLVATPHFGGVEFAVPTMSHLGHNVNAVLKFSTQNLSDKAHEYVESMAGSGHFSPITFIELGKPKTNGAMEMAFALRRGEVLFTVFDEETDYSVPVDLFGKKVEGGAGLHKLIKFAGADITLFNIFMVRLDDSRYEMRLIEVDLTAENPIQEMYNNLESMLKENLVQWYFLHEEVPFLDE